MAGKYAKLQLPAFEQEFSYQQKVDERGTQLALRGLPPGQLAVMFAEVDEELAALERQRSDRQVTKTAIEQEMIRAFDDDDLSSIKTSSGFLCYKQEEPYASLENAEAFRTWAVRERLSSLFRLPWQSMNAIVKERLLGGKTIPAGVKVTMKTTIRKRKA